MPVLLMMVFVLGSAGLSAAQTLARRAAARSTQPPAAAHGKGLVHPGPSDNADARLFAAQPPRDVQAGPVPPQEIVCGTTLWHVDAAVDPRMRLPSVSERVDAKIKKITPPICSTPAGPAPSKR